MLRAIPTGAIRVDLPAVHQQAEHTCGAAALLAICAYYGVGPDTEAALVAELGIDLRGTDPVQLVAAARAHGLAVEEHRGMTRAQLCACLDAGRPVLLTLQAWGEGHWVVAIGYDASGVYVEDPWLEVRRGYLGWEELDARWHCVEGDDDRPLVRYGLAVWHPAPRPAMARVVEP